MINFLRLGASLWRGFKLYLVFLVGRLPAHRIRLLLYKNVFGVRVGRHTSIHWRARFFQPEGVEIGRNSIIGNDCFLDGRLGIRIGNNVNIGGHVQIYTLEHDPDSMDFGTKGGKVVVGDRCYIATRATVLPGVVIGEGAVVAAGAVVTRDVEPYTIVGGVPARFIKERSRNLTYELNYHLPFQ
jgi:acetyltransferase-like isoleucine patch superfamily enzyme